MSVVAKRDIRPGEELFVSYKYSLAQAPDWYIQHWCSHLREELDWSEQQIYSWVIKMYRQTGQTVAMEPPSRANTR
jgi:hypothetical protein